MFSLVMSICCLEKTLLNVLKSLPYRIENIGVDRPRKHVNNKPIKIKSLSVFANLNISSNEASFAFSSFNSSRLL
jgi:hypothetical protein